VILEHAVLDVRTTEIKAFEKAFATAKGIISASPGFLGLELHHCLEITNRYLLLVQWERLEDHTQEFRLSPGYQEWRKLLHHFYQPAPIIDHYELLTKVD
jgi:heme-degrading monooxygenase HmoA